MGVVFSIGEDETLLLEFDDKGNVFYRFNGEMKKVEERDEILEAFSHTILGYTGKDPKTILFDKFLTKIDNNELSEKQLTEIDKRIRKIKLNKIKTI